MSAHDNRPPTEVDVIVMGGDRTGLTAASVLGIHGLRVALIEKNPTTRDEAKTISLGDESLRTLQGAGIDEAVYPIIVPGTGTTDLERALASGPDAFGKVSVYFGAEPIDVRRDRDHVLANVRLPDGPTGTTRAKYSLRCDGGRSAVRELLGIEMSGQSFSQRWLAADVLEHTHDERLGMHVADPQRPHAIVAGHNGRRRHEFELMDGKAVAGKNPPFDLVRRLVERYRTLSPANRSGRWCTASTRSSRTRSSSARLS